MTKEPVPCPDCGCTWEGHAPNCTMKGSDTKCITKGTPMISEQRKMEEAKRTLDQVEKSGPMFTLYWLRSAYHTHESQIEHLLKELQELRQLFLDNVKRSLTVREAQLTNVCRICRKSFSDYRDEREKGTFLLNFGAEFVHEYCVQQERKVVNDITSIDCCW